MKAFKDCKSWHYQLQGVPTVAKVKDVDLLVIDIDQNPKPFLNGERQVAAYLSIGEAEDYRSYWKKLPRNLIYPVNPDWPGNYAVRFWDKRWQDIIFARVQEAKAKGFTCLYLDKVDVPEDIRDRWPRTVKGMDLDDLMVRFLAGIRLQGLPLIQQNAEFLFEDHTELPPLISAVGKEDLWYGADDTGVRNPASEVTYSLEMLKKAKVPVFVVEYLDGPKRRALAADAAKKQGWPIFFDAEDRNLDG